MLLGDAVEKALASVGVTKERVERWLGRPCQCQKRQRKLNALHIWARRLVSGKEKDASGSLDAIMGSDGSDEGGNAGESKRP